MIAGKFQYLWRKHTNRNHQILASRAELAKPVTELETALCSVVKQGSNWIDDLCDDLRRNLNILNVWRRKKVLSDLARVCFDDDVQFAPFFALSPCVLAPGGMVRAM